MARSARAQTGRCPVCWAPIRSGHARCPSCRADLTTAQAAEAEAAAPGPSPAAQVAPSRLVPLERGNKPGRRFGPWIVALMGFAAFASAATLKLVAARLPPPAEFGAATGNVARRIPVRPASAVRALMAFVPAGDVEPIGPSLGFATTDHATLGPGARTTVTPGPHGSEIVTVQAPVDLAFLEKVHAIQTQFGPNLSNVAQGRLYVSAADTNAYGIVMNPSTHVAVFRFRLSASDSTIWPLNLNALQVVSQTQSLG